MSVKEIDLDPNKNFGIGFPLNYDRNAYGFFKKNATYYEQIQDNIKNLLSTQVGERLGNPEYGSRLKELLFEANEPGILQTKIEERIKEALAQFLPFVTLINTQVGTNGNTLNVKAQFRTEFNDEVIVSLQIGTLPEDVPDDVGTLGAYAGGG
tara:strand:- start:921 stop:1379 length:459 start_codon:yes stop_codon:yes gene_type:complete